MTLLRELMNLDLLEQMVDQHMVNVTKHPECDFHILNYSHAAQYSRTWNEATKQCRGLIVDANPFHDRYTAVVARGFPKFFNMSEHDHEDFEDLPIQLPFEVTTKADGSLGILYIGPDGLPAIATRGSFSSDQAIWATKFYQENYLQFCIPGQTTLLFEIIYPSNRIVVNYGDKEDLVLLAAIDTGTGADLDVYSLGWPGPIVQRFHELDLEKLSALCAESPEEYANQEGFVIRFIPDRFAAPSVRAKLKFSEYVRLHRLITGVSKKTIWEFLSSGKPLEDLINDVPDEFYAFVHQTANDLRSQYAELETAALSEFSHRPRNMGRKELAALWANSPYRGLLFRLLDERSIDDLIWRQIKPVAEKPFHQDIDA